MSALLLRLAGPLQSWGYRSRFSDRDTGLEPTKSGVIGLLCCALGRDRGQSPADLAALTMHVRVDREGTLLRDFHTAGGGVFRESREYFAPTSSGGRGKNPVLTERHYLQDAEFLVALQGEDALLDVLAEKVADPVWPLALGRRSCPPSQPVFHGLYAQDAEACLRTQPLAARDGLKRPSESDRKLRLVLECPPGDSNGEMRRDVPVAWPDRLHRDYTIRFVRTEMIGVPKEIPA